MISIASISLSVLLLSSPIVDFTLLNFFQSRPNLNDVITEQPIIRRLYVTFPTKIIRTQSHLTAPNDVVHMTETGQLRTITLSELITDCHFVHFQYHAHLEKCIDYHWFWLHPVEVVRPAKACCIRRCLGEISQCCLYLFHYWSFLSKLNELPCKSCVFQTGLSRPFCWKNLFPV